MGAGDSIEIMVVSRLEVVFLMNNVERLPLFQLAGAIPTIECVAGCAVQIQFQPENAAPTIACEAQLKVDREAGVKIRLADTVPRLPAAMIEPRTGIGHKDGIEAHSFHLESKAPAFDIVDPLECSNIPATNVSDSSTRVFAGDILGIRVVPRLEVVFLKSIVENLLFVVLRWSRTSELGQGRTLNIVLKSIVEHLLFFVLRTRCHIPPCVPAVALKNGNYGIRSLVRGTVTEDKTGPGGCSSGKRRRLGDPHQDPQ